MSSISNKFFIQVIEDGSSLHGQLLANQTPTQSYQGGAFIPNWSTDPSTRPIIYLSLLNGSVATTPDDSSIVWRYNGAMLTFSSIETIQTIGTQTYTGYASTNTGLANKFFKTTYNGMPALGIIGNLASSENVDIDVIEFEGTKTLSMNPVSFKCSINITITQYTSGGYVGVLNFPNGNIISQEGQTLTCTAILYNDTGVVSVATGNYRWYREGIDTSTPWKTGQSITISESDVVDYMVLRCDFYTSKDNTTVLSYSAFGSIDDQKDTDFLWIKFNGQNGNSVSLRTGEFVNYSFCVGTSDNDTPKTEWTNFKVKFLDSEGIVVTSTNGHANDSAFKITPVDGFRPLGSTNGVATAKVYFEDAVNLCKKAITGIIEASTGS